MNIDTHCCDFEYEQKRQAVFMVTLYYSGDDQQYVHRVTL